MTTRGFDAITPAFLQPLLAPRYPGLKVRAVRVEGAIHGTATKVKLALDADGDGPRSLWVKAGWEESSEILRSVGIFSREPRVYAEILPELGLETPACHGATWDDAAMDGVLLLEDVAARSARFHSPLEPLSVDAVAAMLTLLARMHAQTHSAGWLDAHAWLWPLFEDAVRPDSYLAHVSTPSTLDRFLAMPRGRSLPAAARDSGRIAAAMRRTIAFGHADTDRCMLHGDAHIGNSYSLPGGSIGLLDWQCVWRGGWAFDVSYFLCSALAPEDRERHEIALLRHYTGQRAMAGWPEPSLELALEHYRNYLAYGLTVWLTNLPEFQPEDYNAAVAERFARAMLFHGQFER